MTDKILWKIYIIWFFRRILPLMIIELLIAVLALKIFAAKVFVARVLENAALASHADYWFFLKYLTMAFFKTNIIVQIVILVMFGIGALLLRDFGRLVKTYLAILKK